MPETARSRTGSVVSVSECSWWKRAITVHRCGVTIAFIPFIFVAWIGRSADIQEHPLASATAPEGASATAPEGPEGAQRKRPGPVLASFPTGINEYFNAAPVNDWHHNADQAAQCKQKHNKACKTVAPSAPSTIHEIAIPDGEVVATPEGEVVWLPVGFWIHLAASEVV